MKSGQQLFELTSDQKKLISEISTLCGVKQDIVRVVWQYTIFVNYLHLIEDVEKPYSRIQIPLIGSILVKHNKDGELDLFPLISDQLKDVISKTKKGQDAGLIEYFQREFIDKIVDISDEDDV
jgi:hypothetical protein